MTPYQLTVSILSIVLEVLLLFQILKVRQFSFCKLFFFYILAMLIPSLIILFYYDALIHAHLEGQRLYTCFFAGKDILHNLIKAGIIYWLYRKIYHSYPGAKSSIFILLCLTIPFLIYNMATLPTDSEYGLMWDIAYSLDSRIVIWLALIFIILSGGVYFFNLKIDRTLKFILLGFLAYQAPRAIVKILADIFSPSYHLLFSHINQFLILPALAIWILAFIPRPQEEASPGPANPEPGPL